MSAPVGVQQNPWPLLALLQLLLSAWQLAGLSPRHGVVSQT